MALRDRLTPSGGDYNDFIKYNAKMGKFYVKTEGGGPDTEIPAPKLAFDFENARTGWFLFSPGVAPQRVYDPPGGTAEKPESDKFKLGFEVYVWNTELGLRQFSSTASAVVDQMLAMEGQYEAGMAANPNKLPVFQFTGTETITGNHGSNYAPVFQLVSWVERDKIPVQPVAEENPGNPSVYQDDDVPF